VALELLSSAFKALFKPISMLVDTEREFIHLQFIIWLDSLLYTKINPDISTSAEQWPSSVL
jgi:hypothetical protein